jgi:hypothetical protein
MKVLIAMAHYFNSAPSSDFPTAAYGSLDYEESETRTKYVLKSIESYKNAFNEMGMEFEVRVYGVESASLVHIDVDLSRKVESSLHIPWAMIDHVHDSADQFDLILFTEDDILVNSQTICSLIAINRKLKPTELIIPNRIEKFLGLIYAWMCLLFKAGCRREKLFGLY